MNRKAIKAIGAIDATGLEGILLFDQKGCLAEVVPLGVPKHCFDRLVCWHDPNARKLVEAEISEGPFQYIVIFYENQ